MNGFFDSPKKTTVVHCKKNKFDVYIGRPSQWGNPFEIGRDGNRDEVIEKYEEWLLGARTAPNNFPRSSLQEARKVLAGKVLGCWCFPKPCHGDVLARFVDGKKEGENE